MNRAPHLLRDPKSFFDCVRRAKITRIQMGLMALSSIVCLSVYGFVMGLAHSPWQAVSSAIKLPALILGTGLLCLPALYLFSLVLGMRLHLSQAAALVLSGGNVIALLLMGFAPVTLIFVLTSRNYAFFQLLAVGSVGASVCVGSYYMWRGVDQVTLFERVPGNVRRGLMGLWFILYTFVGSQMAWRLSPFIGDPFQPFVWLQPSRDNLYMDVVHAFEQASGVQLSLNGAAQPIWLGGLCLIPLVFLILGAGLISSVEEA